MTALARDEAGSTAIEYALVAALIGLVIVTAYADIGSSVRGMLESIRF